MPSKLKPHLGLVLLTSLFLFNASPALGAQEKQTQQQFIDEVRKNFEEEKFDELDSTAYVARESKDRFPGAEWKLYVFYRTLSFPRAGVNATDQAWTIHLKRLQTWANKAAESMTARIALGAAWVEYAKKVRNDAKDWMAIDKEIGGKQYQERMRQAEKALTFDPAKLTIAFLKKIKRDYSTKTGSALRSYCPHWYVVKLALEQRRDWDWPRYENIFAEGVALEPTYYYLYQTKAADLLPVPMARGTKGQWEAFADNSARSIGGKEGEIAYYMIVSHQRRFFDTSLSQGNFFRDNVISGTRLLEGYKQIQATYGTSGIRQNEMALMASMAKNYAMAKVFFDEIGENWEPSVWQHKSEFDGYKALVTAKVPRAPAAGVISGPYETAPVVQADLSGLKAKVSSRQTSFAKSQDVAIEVLIENPSANAYGLNLAALSLAILDVTKRQSEVTLLPQSNDAPAAGKVIKPGESVSLSYRVNFALKPGEYKIKMKSVASNELAIKIGTAPAAPRRR
ncbi:MAG TPA: hypothetical protein PLD20_22200 [Blastocatellia bacterium]|nr:hypothetical protein [Blastocatellia bacterium]HMV83100.1 hypothetical protein [Blastocatellia bacterium]HMX26621.1 hypothetical protein [Blastocatellia bacterium]HMY70838.1 hypothetical protein [Blastocatellia bacterium]HMZ20666.1 hypothetical protein [Blastocatellia bacterium]